MKNYRHFFGFACPPRPTLCGQTLAYEVYSLDLLRDTPSPESFVAARRRFIFARRRVASLKSAPSVTSAVQSTHLATSRGNDDDPLDALRFGRALPPDMGGSVARSSFDVPEPGPFDLGARDVPSLLNTAMAPLSRQVSFSDVFPGFVSTSDPLFSCDAPGISRRGLSFLLSLPTFPFGFQSQENPFFV